MSYVVPVLNEEATIGLTVQSILDQDYPGEREILLVHGPSTDRTAEALALLTDRHPEISVVDNPAATTPVSMNIGLAHTTLPIVVRVDAHAALPDGYTSTMVAALLEHDAVDVGGRMRATGESPFQRAVAWAYNSPFGLGGGVHHRETGSGPAETAYLGVFRRSALTRVGGYNPTMTRAQDWELCKRLREDGGLVWFESSVEVDYYPRSTWTSLRRQFVASGLWRGMLVRQDPRRSPWRYYAPGALVVLFALTFVMGLSLLAAAALGAVPPMWLLVPLVVPAAYLVAVGVVALAARGLSGGERFRLLAVLPTMHVAWGAGSIVGFARGESVKSTAIAEPGDVVGDAHDRPVATLPDPEPESGSADATKLSFVMPVLNEEPYVEAAVASITAQRGVNVDEIILVLGNSTDRTDEIVAELAERDPRIVVLRNPRNTIPVSLNIGIVAARNPIVARVDAHCELPEDYAAMLVRTLLDNDAVNVGGKMHAEGIGPMQAAVAWSYNSPVGLGGGIYHVGGEAGPAESAYLGLFLRDAVLGVGGFDETLSRGEDWELNQRLIRKGGDVWFEPRVKVIYRPRDSVRALAKQFHASGRWRGEIIRRNPLGGGWRFFVPPALVVTLIASVLWAVAWLTLGGAEMRAMGLAALTVPAVYLVFVVASTASARELVAKARASLLVALPVMHLSWGMGCLLGLMVPSKGDNAFAGR